MQLRTEIDMQAAPCWTHCWRLLVAHMLSLFIQYEQQTALIYAAGKMHGSSLLDCKELAQILVLMRGMMHCLLAVAVACQKVCVLCCTIDCLQSLTAVQTAHMHVLRQFFH